MSSATGTRNATLGTVEVTADSLVIAATVVNADLAAHYQGIPGPERALVLAADLEVARLCHERIAGARDLDFVRQRADAVLHGLERAAAAIPEAVERRLTEKVGDDDGQLLAPLRMSVEFTSR